MACFERDIAGAIGLHRASVVQYIRPEILGFVLGSMIAAFIFRDFKARTGSAPIVRFVLGIFAMIGALLIFLLKNKHGLNLDQFYLLRQTISNEQDCQLNLAHLHTLSKVLWNRYLPHSHQPEWYKNYLIQTYFLSSLLYSLCLVLVQPKPYHMDFKLKASRKDISFLRTPSYMNRQASITP